LSDRALVLHTDALGFLVGLQNTFELIYVAPPQYKRLWAEALKRVAACVPLPRDPSSGDAEDRPPAQVIAQIDPREYECLELDPLVEVRQKRYGNTLLVFYEWPVIERQ